MKATILKITTVLLLAFGMFATSFAQEEETYLQTHKLESFDQLQLNVDTHVILLKSTRNKITLTGDSAFVFNPPLKIQDETLFFDYLNTNEHNLIRVVIEYKDLSRVVTEGTGDFFFHKMDADQIEIHNNLAKVTLNGKADDISIYSQYGNVDVTNLKAKRLRSNMGENATLLVPEEIYTVRL